MADEFSEDEIRKELEHLGYHDIPPERLARLKADLETFVAIDRSKNSSDSTRADDSTLQSSEYAVTSETTDAGYPSNEYAGNNVPASIYKDREQFSTGVDRFNDPSALYLKREKTLHASDTVDKASYSNRHEYSYKPTYINHDYEYDYIPEEITPRIKPGSFENLGYRNSEDLRTYYMSVPERDLLTGFTASSTENLNTTATSTSTCTNGEKKKMKRKVLRKIDGEKRVDESITESETDEDVLGLMRRLTRLPLNEKTNYQDGYTLPRRPYSAAAEPAFRLPDNYEGPKSIIRPLTAHPHTRNIKKTDPVSRHQMYQQSWEKHKRPDEKSRKNLRWSVREQMMYHDEVTKKTSKTYVPNTYVVPSDKKRKALRWQVRQDMAEGVIPHSQWY